MIQRVVIRYGQLIWPDSINVIFQFFNNALVSSTLTLPVKIFTWKKEEPRSPGPAKIL